MINFSLMDRLLFIAIRQNNLKWVKKLLKPTKWHKAANPNAKTNWGDTPVLEAVRIGNLDILKCLVEHGGDINCTNDQKRTPLYSAVWYGRLDHVIYLTSKNPQLETVGDGKYTALTLAVERGYYKIVKHLLDCGANIDFRDDFKNTLLNTTILKADERKYLTTEYDDINYLEIIPALLKKGIDINAQDICGYTALATAAKHGLFDFVKCLVEYGADITITNINSDTPVEVAKDFPEIVKYLKMVQKDPLKYQTKVKENFLQQVPEMSTSELRKLPVTNPELLEKLFAFGIVVEMFNHLSYAKQLSFYRITQNRLTPQEKDIVHDIIQKTQQQRGLNG